MAIIKKYRSLVGYKTIPSLEVNNTQELAECFDASLPKDILEFLCSMSDCVLYYRYDAPIKPGKTRAFSQFTTTDIGPHPGEQTYQPASLIGFLRRFREHGMPRHFLPIMFESSKDKCLFCDLRPDSYGEIVVHTNELTFGSGQREWTRIAADFASLIENLQPDIKPLMPVIRLSGGVDRVSKETDELLTALLGPRWRDHEMFKGKSRR